MEKCAGRAGGKFALFGLMRGPSVSAVQQEMNFTEELQVERTFLGWGEPLVSGVVDWLWERRDELPHCMVVVPTSQSGRRLREMLAERGGCLAPQVVTPAHFFRTTGGGEMAELVAWETVIRRTQWEDYEAIMPAEAAVGPLAGQGLLQQLQAVRSELVEAGLDIRRAVKKLGAEHPELERWEALLRLEDDYGKEMRRLDLADPQDAKRRAAAGMAIPRGVRKLVVAGVPDPVPLARQVWERWAKSLPVEVLIHAPEEEEAAFDAWGEPEPDIWIGRELDVGGNEAIEIGEEPADQARAARQVIADELGGKRAIGREHLALGICDPSLMPEVTRVFSEGGWTLFDPAGKTLRQSGLTSWLETLCDWLEKDDVVSLSELLPQIWTERLLERKTYWLASQLARVVDSALPQTSGDFAQLKEALWLREEAREAAENVEKVCNSLGYYKSRLNIQGVALTMREILEKILKDEMTDMMRHISPILDEVHALERKVSMPAARWGSLLCRALSRVAVDSPTAEQSLDAQGWLELSYEAAPLLVLCGFNEGFVPTHTQGDAWLPNGMRSRLGLKDNRARYARDAYLTRSLVEGRRASGRVHFILGRTASGGESLVPSRLLLTPPEAELPGRVKHAFRPPEHTREVLTWTRDWLLKVPEEKNTGSLSPTKLATYLKCPFRYYLKHVLHMQEPEGLREEWSAREFGTVIHEVLERFGRDEAARDLTDVSRLTEWLWQALEEVVDERFSDGPPLAIEIQLEAMKQRLYFFSKEQCQRRLDGWEIQEVELKFAFDLDGLPLRGVIDRIDYHPELDQWMVWDYKTGKDALNPKGAHCKTFSAGNEPQHLEGSDLFEMMARPRSNSRADAVHMWTNLQLPLYAAWLWKEKKVQAGVGYISLISTSHDVGFRPWENYREEYTDGALAAAGEVARMIRRQVFWPPSDKVLESYDDYSELMDNETLAEAVSAPENWENGGGDE